MLNENMIKLASFENCRAGDFVEFESKLQLLSLVDVFDSYLSVFKMAIGFDDGEHKDKEKKLENNKHRVLMMSMENIAKKFREERSNIDLIGGITGHETKEMSVVISLDRNFLTGNSMSDLIDASFRVLGKVIRVLPEESTESIDLMRNTSLSKMGDSMISQFMSGLSELPNSGFKHERILTRVNSPAMQIIPLAIFA